MTPAQKTRGLILILGLYVVIAVIGFFLVYFIKTTFFPTKQPVQSTSTSPASSVIKKTTPAGWKTYHDTKISFSYPADLTLKATSYQLGVANIEMRTADNTNPNNAANFQILLVPKALALAAGQDFDGYYALPNNATKQVSSPLSANKSQQNFTKLTNRTLAGHRAFNYRSAAANATTNDEAEVGAFIEDGSSLMLISTGESSKELLEQMLQSVTFTN